MKTVVSEQPLCVRGTSIRIKENDSKFVFAATRFPCEIEVAELRRLDQPAILLLDAKEVEIFSKTINPKM